MPRLILGLAVLGGLAAMSPESHAQLPNNLNDPFVQYYAWFLPRQAAIAAQPKVQDQINAVAAARAQVAAIDRSGLYNPTSPFSLDAGDPSQPFQRQGGRSSRGSAMYTSTNINGEGHSAYFNRTAAYHPYYRPVRGQYIAPRTNVGGVARGMMGVPTPPSFGGGIR
jgi:hypothetical protein